MIKYVIFFLYKCEKVFFILSNCEIKLYLLCCYLLSYIGFKIVFGLFLNN